MTQRDKLYEKFMRDPSSISYMELQKILGWYEFEKIQAKGSHVKYKHPLFESDFDLRRTRSPKDGPSD